MAYENEKNVDSYNNMNECNRFLQTNNMFDRVYDYIVTNGVLDIVVTYVKQSCIHYDNPTGYRITKYPVGDVWFIKISQEYKTNDKITFRKICAFNNQNTIVNYQGYIGIDEMMRVLVEINNIVSVKHDFDTINKVLDKIDFFNKIKRALLNIEGANDVVTLVDDDNNVSDFAVSLCNELDKTIIRVAERAVTAIGNTSGNMTYSDAIVVEIREDNTVEGIGYCENVDRVVRVIVNLIDVLINKISKNKTKIDTENIKDVDVVEEPITEIQSNNRITYSRIDEYVDSICDITEKYAMGCAAHFKPHDKYELELSTESIKKYLGRKRLTKKSLETLKKKFNSKGYGIFVHGVNIRLIVPNMLDYKKEYTIEELQKRNKLLDAMNQKVK